MTTTPEQQMHPLDPLDRLVHAITRMPYAGNAALSHSIGFSSKAELTDEYLNRLADFMEDFRDNLESVVYDQQEDAAELERYRQMRSSVRWFMDGDE